MKPFVTKLQLRGYPNTIGLRGDKKVTTKVSVDTYFKESKDSFIKWIKTRIVKSGFEFDPTLYKYKVVKDKEGVLWFYVTITFIDEISNTQQQARKMINKTGLMGQLLSDGTVKIIQLAKQS